MRMLQFKLLIILITLAAGGALAILAAVGGLFRGPAPDWVSDDTASHAAGGGSAYGDGAQNVQISLTSFAGATNKSDQTAWIQRAIDSTSRSGQTLRIPRAAKPYRVHPIQLPTHAHVVFEPGTVLQAAAGYGNFDRMINVVNARDVEVVGYGATLRMNNAEYKTGEYRHCLYISGSTGVKVSGVTCADSGGDGFYISGSDKKPFSEDVALDEVKASGSNRNGLTIISAKDMTVRHSTFRRSSGVKPDSGIDLEPESTTDRLDSVRIEDSLTDENAGQGIRIGISKLTGSSYPVQVVISRHHDRRSGENGLLATDETKGIHDVQGTVSIDHFSSESPRMYGVLFSFWSSTGPRAIVTDAQILNANQGHDTDDNTAIGIVRGGGGFGYVGNIEFLHTSIRDTEQKPLINYYFSFHDYSNKGFSKVGFSEPDSLSGASHQHPFGLIQGQPVDTINLDDEKALSALWRQAEAESKTRAAMKKISGVVKTSIVPELDQLGLERNAVRQ